MKLTVVGCAGSFPSADSPASCYLIEAPHHGRTYRLVVDLGSGALGALQRYVDLRDVVLVSQHEARVEVYSRDERGRWVLSTANAGERFSLTAMDGAIEVDRVYADVELAPAPPRAARD